MTPEEFRQEFGPNANLRRAPDNDNDFVLVNERPRLEDLPNNRNGNVGGEYLKNKMHSKL